MSSNNSNISKNRTDAVLSDIDNWSHAQYAQLFFDGNHNKYIWSNKTGWYYYNIHNILVSAGKEPPFDLLNNIIDYLNNYIKNQMNKISIDNEEYIKAQKSYIKAHKLISTSTFSKSIILLLNKYYFIENIDDKIDAKKELFAFKNKVWDIKEGLLRDINKDDYISRNTGYDAPYTMDNKDDIDELLFTIFEDKEICDYFLFITAMSLYTNRFEKLYILTGNGRNGKGVLTSLIQKSLGSYFQAGSNDLLTIKDEQKNCTLANAKGTRYMAISEPAEDDRGETKFNVSMVKKLTGGDVIAPRALYKDPIEYIPQFTMFISCNRQPSIDEMNDAVKNRFRFIHFPFTFVEKPTKKHERLIDASLKDRITKDDDLRDAFIMYLLHLVSQDYSTEKIKEPSKCIIFKNNYFDENDDIGSFLEKHITIIDDDTKTIRSTDLFKMYTEDVEYKKLSLVKFGDGIKMHNIKKKKFKDGFYYTGLIKNEEDDEEAAGCTVASSLDI